jgi:multidrug efflux pump subunit AcrA (membrane-fusion protein)
MTLPRAFRPIAIAFLVLGLVAAAILTRGSWLPLVFPARTEKDAAQETDHHDHPVDRIELSEQAQRNLGIESKALAPRQYWRTITIPGAVVDRPGESDRGVAARVAGIVAAIHARPGETVKPGAPLFDLDLVSEVLQSAQVELARTATDLALAITERDRIKRLVDLGTMPAADLTRQLSQVDRLTTLAKSLRRQLQLFGLTQEQVARAEEGDVVTRVTVTAPPAGSADALFEMKELKVRLGEHVQAGQALATLADHRRLYVEGWAFKTEAKALAVAAEKQVKVEVEFLDEDPGDWRETPPLTIHHLASAVDPVNRTFPFYLSLNNEARTIARDGKTYLAWRFRPGQRARLRLPVERLVTPGVGGEGKDADPFVVPAGAVVREGPEAFVFVQAGDLFIRKPVRVLYQDDREAVIANDGSITRAELIVLNQAAAINRAIKAQSTEGGHHHHDH